ncbi:hypothetical protein BT96DRAFT_938358 [Gymnopus androsaceus JB14]|uniref:ATP synthase alpha subunit C-terminal domain-containing protein n=1 Tax=Gymnopus androsaceus JB14 TaxID=1447944 RepID=A0A6A4HSH3_9AGAR|nr:hypothetical protein BT96DRAFT_938358 [Gymnopus androsaceus JB14]
MAWHHVTSCHVLALITPSLGFRIAGMSAGTFIEETGQVLSVCDSIDRVWGLRNIQDSKILFWCPWHVEADEAGVSIFGNDCLIKEGSTVKQTGQIVNVPIGPGLLGCVVDALGDPIDGKALSMQPSVTVLPSKHLKRWNNGKDKTMKLYTAQIKIMKKSADSLELYLAQYHEVAAFTQLGTDLDASTCFLLSCGACLTELFKRGRCQPPSAEIQVPIIYAGKSTSSLALSLSTKLSSILTLTSEQTAPLEEISGGNINPELEGHVLDVQLE